MDVVSIKGPTIRVDQITEVHTQMVVVEGHSLRNVASGVIRLTTAIAVAD